MNAEKVLWISRASGGHAASRATQRASAAAARAWCLCNLDRDPVGGRKVWQWPCIFKEVLLFRAQILLASDMRGLRAAPFFAALAQRSPRARGLRLPAWTVTRP